MRLELGTGNRPTDGYLHQDIIQLDTKLDYLCPVFNITDKFDEIIAIAVMEHFTYAGLRRAMSHIYSILNPGGVFYFDVPDLEVWNKYLYRILSDPKNENTRFCPYSREDVLKTMWGWQRFEGDEHKSMWTRDMIYSECYMAGFVAVDGFDDIRQRVYRDRFSHPENAHIFIKASKP